MNTLYRLCTLVALSCLLCLEASAQAQDPLDGVAYVLFFGNADRPTVKANPAEEAAARNAQQVIGARFMMWFKLNGTAYVSQDQPTMDRVNQLINARWWQPSAVANAEEVRKENAAYVVTHPASVTERNIAEFRQLSEGVRQTISLPVTKDQDVTELRKRVLAMSDIVHEMQSELNRREVAVRSLQSAEQRIQELGTERKVLSDAIAAGKAQLAP
jgi:hypothetical protein